MKIFVILGLVTLIVISVVFAGYAITTSQIIKGQEREIEDLRKALHKPYTEKKRVSDDTIKFGGF